jgi:Trk K+ transport system NAD-binding subunit
MTVNLTPHAEELLQQLVQTSSPEQVVEEALERLVAERGTVERRMTPHEAVSLIREVRKGTSLGGISIRELINEGRKY